ncbi:MAG: S41 family peptidase [Gammaproteobacteria bacterium]
MRLNIFNDSAASPRRPLVLASIVSRTARVLGTAAFLLLAGCGGSGGGGNATPLLDPCTQQGQKLSVITAMEDLYFWNDEPEQDQKYVNLVTSDYADTDELLDFLRYQPDEFDRNFTRVVPIEEDEQFFGPGQFVGYGFSFFMESVTNEVTITQAFAGSPAAAAGFARGTRILEVDGRTIDDIEAAEGIGEAFGASEEGVTQTFLLRPPGELPFFTTATKAVVTIDPVPQYKVIDAGGLKLGYIEFRSFVSTAAAKLAEAFATFAAAGVTRVIVDVRYNGGGLVNLADQFASLLAGPGNVGMVASHTRYNSANAGLDRMTTFTAQPNSIDLDAIVFITTEDSASATELVINSLEPYVDVALAGARTFGKPVGQNGVDFCDQRLRLVSFETVNVNEFGSYFDGLPVDCPAEDNLSLPVGDEFEDSLATALTRIITGACPIISKPGGAQLTSFDRERIRARTRGDSAAREFSYAY